VTGMSSEAIRVLIVDDARSMRSVLAALLGRNGFQVVGELEDGLRVSEVVAELRPHLVCLDFNMPGCDGLSVLRALQAEHPNVAVVMLTGDTTPTLRADAAEAGAAGFLAKPFSPEQILAELRNVATALHLLNNSPAGDVPDLVIEQARAVIADDSLTLRRLLRVILEDCGVAVVAEARDGRQAIDMVREHKPDLLCLDVEMPVMDGIAALAHIRAIAPELPVMMITGRADRETVQGAAKMGARGYIVKPYHRDKVNAAVRHLLKLG
jgi:two-component system chemotaxis response regulator CheY